MYLNNENKGKDSCWEPKENVEKKLTAANIYRKWNWGWNRLWIRYFRTGDEAEYTDSEQNSEIAKNSEFPFYELDTDLDAKDQEDIDYSWQAIQNIKPVLQACEQEVDLMEVYIYEKIGAQFLK